MGFHNEVPLRQEGCKNIWRLSFALNPLHINLSQHLNLVLVKTLKDLQYDFRSNLPLEFRKRESFSGVK